MEFPKNPAPAPSFSDDEAPEAPEAPRKRKQAAVGVAAPIDTNKPAWENRDADMLWPEVLSWLPSVGKSPYDVDARVEVLDPVPRRSLGTLSGSALVGDGTMGPGDVLTVAIDNNFHLPTARTPAKYMVTFTWRATGKGLAWGPLMRPSPDEIIAVRRAQHALRQQAPPLGQDMSGMGAPTGAPQAYGTPPSPQWGPPPSAWSPYGYGAPPTPPQGTIDPEVVNLRAQVATMSGQLAMVLEHLQRQGAVAAPQGLGQAPQIIMQAPVAPAPPAQVGLGLGGARQLLEAFRELQGFHQQLGEVFNRPDPAAPPIVESPAEDDKPGLGLHVYPIPETTLKLAKDAETGNIDWGMTALANADSEVGKKAMEIVGNAMAGLTRLAGVKDGNVIPSGPPALGANGSTGVGSGSGGWTPN